jgi:predicted MFS family arabinose efflux permease
MQEDLRVSSQFIFIVYGMNSIAGNLGFYLTKVAMDNFKDFKIIRAVLIARVFLVLLIIIASFFRYKDISIWITYISFIIIGFTWPFFYIPITIQATNLTSPGTRGKILGIFNAAISLAVITASFASGSVALRFGYQTVFLIGSILLLVSERIFTKALSKV